MKEDTSFRSFEEFWPHYLREHSRAGTRALHLVGTSLAVATAACGLLLRRPSLLLAAPVLGYGLSWVGHFFIEHNRPATFDHPLWSLQGDLKMWSLFITGALDAELERVMSSNGVHHANGVNGVDSTAHAAPDPQTVN